MTSGPFPPSPGLVNSTVVLHAAALLARTVRHSAYPVPIRLVLLVVAMVSAACAAAVAVLGLSGPREPVVRKVAGAAWGADMVSVPGRAPLPCAPPAGASLRAPCIHPECPGADPCP